MHPQALTVAIWKCVCVFGGGMKQGKGRRKLGGTQKAMGCIILLYGPRFYFHARAGLYRC